MSQTITPIILCGGAGTRLWPASRQSFPKQFSTLMGDESLFQGSVRRAQGDGFEAPLIVTSDAFRFVVREQLDAIATAPGAILIEPCPKNTAAACLSAALWLAREDPERLMLILPADHLIADAAAFRAAVHKAAPEARNGTFITFGVTPRHPETGYGYLELATAGPATQEGPEPLASFVEKPDLETAQRLVASGRHLWNAGIFLCTASDLIAAFRQHAPDIHAAVSTATAAASTDLGFTRLDNTAWQSLRSVSLDHAIMEKVTALAVMRLSGAWSDLGSWDAVLQASASDEQGNVVSSHATAIDCHGSLLRSEAATLELIGIGLEDIVAVAMPDAVLIARKSETQKVKEAVEILKARQAEQASSFLSDHRPWGSYERLATGERFQVKRIVVRPGAALSLQSHFHRAEHWIVVQGTARVTIGETVELLSENQSVYVPLGAVHRLENPGKVPVVLIEVQTGSYLGEDDILRYEDQYHRD